MKRILLTLIFLFVTINLYTDAFTKEDPKKKLRLKKPDIVDLVFVSYNNWSYVMRNNGSYMYDPNDANASFDNAGGEFPRGSGNTLVFAGGLYIGAIKNGIPVVSETYFGTEFQPGRIINSGVSFELLKTENPMSPAQQVYLIDRARTGEDYFNWPEDALHDALGGPALIADAQTWAVFNDLDTSLSTESTISSPNPGLGIEVIMESYAFASPTIGDVVYIRYMLTNKTSSDYSQSYFAVWSDPDVGGNSGNDIVGVDTSRSLGYTYNNTNEAPSNYAVGFDIMQGPVAQLAEIPANDAQKFSGNTYQLSYLPSKNRFQSMPLPQNYVTLGATSFYGQASDPGLNDWSNSGRYDDMRGVNPWIGIKKSGCGFDDYFTFRGNPLTEQGTCDVAGSNNPIGGLYSLSADMRNLLSTGPFTIKAGESQEIWVGVVGAKGVDRFDAVANLFETDDIAQTFFDQGFPTPAPPEVPNLTVTPLDGKVVLTWQNNAEVTEDLTGELLGVSVDSGFSANYVKNDFQGYRVYRSLTGLDGSFELLAQYDVVDTLGILAYRFLNANDNLEIGEVNLGSNTGLRYTFTDSNLTNGQNYFYSVTAYDAQPYIAGPDSMLFDGQYILKPAGLPVSLESSILSNAVSAVPSRPAASTVKDIKVVPNPFYKYSSYETSFDKLIKFTNLPSTCTIKIFTVAGDLIRTLKHNATSDNDRVNTDPYDETFVPAEDVTSIERWDLRTQNGRYVASGMYIALIESTAGKKFVKFAVIQ